MEERLDDAINILKTHAEGQPLLGGPPPAYASNLTQLECHVVRYQPTYATRSLINPFLQAAKPVDYRRGTATARRPQQRPPWPCSHARRTSVELTRYSSRVHRQR